MKDETLADIIEELQRLRRRLAQRKVRRAAVLLLVEDKCYFAVKTATQEEAKTYLGEGVLQAFIRGGLTTADEVEKL